MMDVIRGVEMADEAEEAYKGPGHITREHTAWCGGCAYWQTFASYLKRDVIDKMKVQGWRKRNGKWHCPDCALREFALSRD